jgi:hypothetical protein
MKVRRRLIIRLYLEKNGSGERIEFADIRRQRCNMRVVTIPVFALLLLATASHASAINETVPDTNSMLALAAKAERAEAKDQCFLYAELVHQMTELAGRQMNAGDDAQATLKAVHEYAQKIHMNVANDNKRLKNAQILMEHTAFRLQEIMHSAALDDRPVLESTLKQLDQVQTELMMQVFKK